MCAHLRPLAGGQGVPPHILDSVGADRQVRMQITLLFFHAHSWHNWHINLLAVHIDTSCSLFTDRAIFWILFGLSTSIYMLYGILTLTLVTGSITPYTRTILSNSVDHEYQAKMFSGFSAMESISSLVSPLFSVGYAITVGSWDTCMFYLMSAINLISLSLILYVIYTPELCMNVSDHAFGIFGEHRLLECEKLDEDRKKALGDELMRKNIGAEMTEMQVSL